MPDLPRRHQSKQGPCRLRGGGGSTLEPPIVEAITGGILAPTPILVLDRYQPVRSLADRGVLVAQPSGAEWPHRRPPPLNMVHRPPTIPLSPRKLPPTALVPPRHHRLLP